MNLSQSSSWTVAYKRYVSVGVLLVTVVTSASLGASQTFVDSEEGLFSALWDTSVVDIILRADVHVSDPRLWSQPFADRLRPSLQPRLTNHAIPIRRHLTMRSLSSPRGASTTEPWPTGSPLRLPLLDLRQMEGWLQLLPNASIHFQGLHLASSLPGFQPDLAPYRPLLRAMLAVPPQPTDPAAPTLVAIVLEQCLETVDQGLPQAHAAAATAALQPLSASLLAAVADRASARSGSAGAWATLAALVTTGSIPPPSAAARSVVPAGAGAVVRPVSGQLCVCGSSRLAGRGGAREEPVRDKRRGQATPAEAALQQSASWWRQWWWRQRRRPQPWQPWLREWVAWGWGGLGQAGRRLVAGEGCGATAGGGGAVIDDCEAAAALVCLEGAVLVDRAATAVAVRAAAGGSGPAGDVSFLEAITEPLPTPEADQVKGERGFRGSPGGSSSSFATAVEAAPSASAAPLPVAVVVLQVVCSLSAAQAQLDEACLPHGTQQTPGATELAECVRQQRLRGGGAAARLLGEGPDAGRPAASPAPVAAPAPSGNNRNTAFVATLAALLPVSVLLCCALAVVGCLYRRLHRRHSRERGARQAPGVGPSTTLLITDIANSTALWESLPEEVMDLALKLHHACLRALLQRFNGYESATEGDSFILAFHHPTDAAKFALSAQVQLMDVMWPAEVLAHPDGQEVWVVPRSADLGAPPASHSAALPALPPPDPGAAASSMSVQRSSGGLIGGPTAGGSVGPTAGGMALRTADGTYVLPPHPLSAGAGGVVGGMVGSVRASWSSRAKSFKLGAGGAGGGGPLRRNRSLRSLELERMSASDLDVEEFPYGSVRTGSNLLRSFTWRMSTMLGLAPAPAVAAASAPVGVPVGVGAAVAAAAAAAAAANLSGRPSSRMGRLLHVSLNAGRAGRAGDLGPESLPAAGSYQDTSSPPGYQLGGSGPLQVPCPQQPDGRRQTAVRSKSFAMALLWPAAHRASTLKGTGSGPMSATATASGAVVGATSPVAVPGAGGSFTSSARSLLRQALSFHRRQASFRVSSRPAAAAGEAAASSPTDTGVEAGDSGGGQLVLASSAPSLPASPRGFSSPTDPYPRRAGATPLPPGANEAAGQGLVAEMAAAAARDASRGQGQGSPSPYRCATISSPPAETGQLSSRDVSIVSVGAGVLSSGGGGGYVGGPGGVLYGGLIRLGGRGGGSSSGMSVTVVRNATGTGAGDSPTTGLHGAGPSAALAATRRSQEGPASGRQHAALGYPNATAVAGLGAGDACAPSSGSRAALMSPLRRRSGASAEDLGSLMAPGPHCRNLHGEVVTGVSYCTPGLEPPPDQRLRPSLDDPDAATATSTRSNPGVVRESLLPPSVLCPSTLGGAGSSNATDDARRLSNNSSLALALDALDSAARNSGAREGGGGGGHGGPAAAAALSLELLCPAPRLPAPRVPRGLRLHRSGAPPDVRALALAMIGYEAPAAGVPTTKGQDATPQPNSSGQVISSVVGVAGEYGDSTGGCLSQDSNGGAAAHAPCGLTHGGLNPPDHPDYTGAAGVPAAGGPTTVNGKRKATSVPELTDNQLYGMDLDSDMSTMPHEGSGALPPSGSLVAPGGAAGSPTGGDNNFDSVQLFLQIGLGGGTSSGQLSGSTAAAPTPSLTAALPSPLGAATHSDNNNGGSPVPPAIRAAATVAEAHPSRRAPSPASTGVPADASEPYTGRRRSTGAPVSDTLPSLGRLPTSPLSKHLRTGGPGFAPPARAGGGSGGGGFPAPTRGASSLGGGGGGPGAGGSGTSRAASLSAAIARMLLSKSTRVHSSIPLVRSKGWDLEAVMLGQAAGGSGSGGAFTRLSALAPIPEPRDPTSTTTRSTEEHRSASNEDDGGGGTTTGGSVALGYGEELDGAAAGVASSGGEGASTPLSTRAVPISVRTPVSKNAGLALWRGAGGGAGGGDYITDSSPSRSPSMSLVYSGLLRAGLIVRQLTRDRSGGVLSATPTGASTGKEASGSYVLTSTGGDAGTTTGAATLPSGGGDGGGGGTGSTGGSGGGGACGRQPLDSLIAGAILAPSDTEPGSSCMELSAVGMVMDGALRFLPVGQQRGQLRSAFESSHGGGSQSQLGGRSSGLVDVGTGLLGTAALSSGPFLGTGTLMATGPLLATGNIEALDPATSPVAVTSAEDGNGNGGGGASPGALTSASPTPRPRDAKPLGRISPAARAHPRAKTLPQAPTQFPLLATRSSLLPFPQPSGPSILGGPPSTSAASVTAAGFYSRGGPPPLPPFAPLSGAGSRRLSFLGGLGNLVPRSRATERRQSMEFLQVTELPGGGWQGSLTGAASQTVVGLLADCRSWREKCRDEWPPAVRPAPPARCAYRGLRVRMGLHTGVTSSSDVTFNPTTSHMAYGGTALKAAKAVGDAAAGGMILVSQSSFQALVSTLVELPGTPQAVFSGESCLGLGPDAAPTCLYQLVHRELVPRLGYATPLRNIRLTQLGTEDAPTGFCAISFMHVASASMLVAELGQPGVEALQQFKSIVTDLCSRCGGYVVEASEGLCLAAFRHAAAALVWALCSREVLADHPWSPEVRRWYRSALAVSSHHQAGGGAGGGGGGGGGGHRAGNRGPRPRTGVHVGGVNVEVNGATGRMTYRGKVMNRTSRIAHKASSEQILCSREAWEAAEASIQAMVREIREERLRAAEAAAAAAAAATRSSTPEPDDDMFSQVGSGHGGGGGGRGGNLSTAASGKSLLRPSVPLGHESKHGSPPSTRASLLLGGVLGLGSPTAALLAGGGMGGAAGGGGGAGSGGLARVIPRQLSMRMHKSNSATALTRGGSTGTPAAAAASTSAGGGTGGGEGGAFETTDTVSRLRAASSLAASLAASVRAHRSASAKQLSAAAAALSRRVTSFTYRGSPMASITEAAPGRPLARAPSATTGPAPSGGSLLRRFPTLTSPTGRSFADVIASSVLGGGGAGPPGPLAAATPGAPGKQGSESGPGGGGEAGDTGDPRVSPQSPEPSLEWQALGRLVGPNVKLPAAKRLDAHFLGSYSLKGVREEMRLFEVSWAGEGEGSSSSSEGDSDMEALRRHLGAGGGGGRGTYGSITGARPDSGVGGGGRRSLGLVGPHSGREATRARALPVMVGGQDRPAGSLAPGVADNKGPVVVVSTARMASAGAVSPFVTAGMEGGGGRECDVYSNSGGGGGGGGGGHHRLGVPADPLALAAGGSNNWVPGGRSGRSEWLVTDTGCTLYDDDTPLHTTTHTTGNVVADPGQVVSGGLRPGAGAAASIPDVPTSTWRQGSGNGGGGGSGGVASGGLHDSSREGINTGGGHVGVGVLPNWTQSLRAASGPAAGGTVQPPETLALQQAFSTAGRAPASVGAMGPPSSAGAAAAAGATFGWMPPPGLRIGSPVAVLPPPPRSVASCPPPGADDNRLQPGGQGQQGQGQQGQGQQGEAGHIGVPVYSHSGSGASPPPLPSAGGGSGGGGSGGGGRGGLGATSWEPDSGPRRRAVPSGQSLGVKFAEPVDTSPVKGGGGSPIAAAAGYPYASALFPTSRGGASPPAVSPFQYPAAPPHWSRKQLQPPGPGPVQLTSTSPAAHHRLASPADADALSAAVPYSSSPSQQAESTRRSGWRAGAVGAEERPGSGPAGRSPPRGPPGAAAAVVVAMAVVDADGGGGALAAGGSFSRLSGQQRPASAVDSGPSRFRGAAAGGGGGNSGSAAAVAAAASRAYSRASSSLGREWTAARRRSAEDPAPPLLPPTGARLYHQRSVPSQSYYRAPASSLQQPAHSPSPQPLNPAPWPPVRTAWSGAGAGGWVDPAGSTSLSSGPGMPQDLLPLPPPPPPPRPLATPEIEEAGV